VEFHMAEDSTATKSASSEGIRQQGGPFHTHVYLLAL
jgi:hypothetical protein